MSTGLLLVSTALKIAFVLAIIFVFAPVLIWAERRQSAMLQDRIGPVRAGFQLPGWTVPLAEVGWKVLAGLAALAAVPPVYWLVLGLMTAIRDGVPVDVPPAFWNWLLLAVALFLAAGPPRLLAASRGRVTVAGLLHPLADALKFIWKEDFVPPRADRLLHALAPIVTVIPAIVTFAVIPFGDTLYLDWVGERLPADGAPTGPAIPLQVASLDVGILFLFAIAGTGVVGAAIAGYASDNKYSLLGGLRAAGQMVSYEVTLGLTLVPMFMIYGSLRLEEMARWQAEHLWGIALQPVAFVLYLAASIAETKRIPFDVPEGESEIVGGYFTEYSGMKFGMFFMGEFIEVIVLAALATTLFFGGWDVPGLERSGFVLGPWAVPMPHGAVVAIQVLAFVVKLALLIWAQLMIRWTLPRFRYDQIMKVCWQYILPLSLANILATGIVLLLVAR
ncbi:MAG: NADH-quinone oxidoreductase subunit H [Myxococcota bacterium]|nr:NADH-quinone oxidoreductase subunit H [Myxococcota bacterium]MDW8362300.1 complex I subunit 1 family protein [Myxococcales bacterium]